MPDSRRHRGPHPEDRQLFAEEHWPALREAAYELSWLLSRGYALNSSLKLVGDRRQLDARQRLATARCACSDEDALRRAEHEVDAASIRGEEVWIDGYNLLTTLEAAMAGGVILKGRDGCLRDMASMHGSYRKVAETIPALRLAGETFDGLHVARCRWLLDQPVSNSGRLKSLILATANEHHWTWQVDLVRDPDAILAASDRIVASADSQVLNRAQRWFNMARAVIDARLPNAWRVDLSTRLA